MIDTEKYEQLIFEEDDLKDFVIDKLIHPIGSFIENNKTIFNGLLKDDEINRIKIFKSKKGRGNKCEPRIILLGYHKQTNMLHLLLLNDKYGEKSNELKSKEIIRGFIGIVSDYLDPANPLEVILDAIRENNIDKGLTQISIKNKDGKNGEWNPKIVFSYFASFDARSRNSIYFDIPLKLEKTFYVPLYDNSKLNENTLIGVLLISFDYNDEIKNCDLNQKIKQIKKSKEYRNYLKNYQRLITNHKKRDKKLESEEWFKKFKSKYFDTFEKVNKLIKNKSIIIQKNLKKHNVCDVLNKDRNIRYGKKILKKLLFNRLFIYEEFLNIVDSYVLYECDKLLKNIKK